MTSRMRMSARSVRSGWISASPDSPPSLRSISANAGGDRVACSSALAMSWAVTVSISRRARLRCRVRTYSGSSSTSRPWEEEVMDSLP